MIKIYFKEIEVTLANFMLVQDEFEQALNSDTKSRLITVQYTEKSSNYRQSLSDLLKLKKKTVLSAFNKQVVKFQNTQNFKFTKLDEVLNSAYICINNTHLKVLNYTKSNRRYVIFGLTPNNVVEEFEIIDIKMFNFKTSTKEIFEEHKHKFEGDVVSIDVLLKYLNVNSSKTIHITTPNIKVLHENVNVTVFMSKMQLYICIKPILTQGNKMFTYVFDVSEIKMKSKKINTKKHTNFLFGDTEIKVISR